MIYRQKVKIKKRNIQEVTDAFHNIEFVRFLVSIQPVRIIEWSGINNNLIAHLQFWLLKWHSFIVIHKNYKNTDTMLSFFDEGVKLPMGLKYWKHEHVIKKDEDQILIEDIVNFRHKSFIIGIIIYPILISPILIRKILYPLYFKNNN